MKLTAKARLFTETLPALKSARAYFSRPAIQAAATAAGLELKPGVLNVYLHRAVKQGLIVRYLLPRKPSPDESHGRPPLPGSGDLGTPSRMRVRCRESLKRKR